MNDAIGHQIIAGKNGCRRVVVIQQFASCQVTTLGFEITLDNKIIAYWRFASRKAFL
jgi:hypothetical protein